MEDLSSEKAEKWASDVYLKWRAGKEFDMSDIEKAVKIMYYDDGYAYEDDEKAYGASPTPDGRIKPDYDSICNAVHLAMVEKLPGAETLRVNAVNLLKDHEFTPSYISWMGRIATEEEFINYNINGSLRLNSEIKAQKKRARDYIGIGIFVAAVALGAGFMIGSAYQAEMTGTDIVEVFEK